MKFQFLILLALVGFAASQVTVESGTSQISEDSTNPEQCFTSRLERIPPTKDFSEDATNLARGLLLNPACGSPDKCFPEFKESMKMSCIQDAPKLAEYLQNAFVPCFEFLQRTAV